MLGNLFAQPLSMSSLVFLLLYIEEVKVCWQWFAPYVRK